MVGSQPCVRKSVTIRGGYTTSFNEPPDPVANPTTLDAQGNGRVLFIAGVYFRPYISPTIEGLRIIGGDSTVLASSEGRDADCGLQIADCEFENSDKKWNSFHQ